MQQLLLNKIYKQLSNLTRKFLFLAGLGLNIFRLHLNIRLGSNILRLSVRGFGAGLGLV